MKSKIEKIIYTVYLYDSRSRKFYPTMSTSSRDGAISIMRKHPIAKVKESPSFYRPPHVSYKNRRGF